MPIEDAALRASYRASLTAIVVPGATPMTKAITAELQRGLGGLLGAPPSIASTVGAGGALLVGTPSSSPAIAALNWSADLAGGG